jgi:hypothetical protein
VGLKSKLRLMTRIFNSLPPLVLEFIVLSKCGNLKGALNARA